MPKRILRLPGVKTTTGLCRSTIYLRMEEGSFPRPISLGGRAVGWLEEEVEAWLSTQIARSGEVRANERKQLLRLGQAWPSGIAGQAKSNDYHTLLMAISDAAAPVIGLDEI